MKKVLSLLLCVCMLLPCFTVSASVAVFTDLAGHWAESYVMPLYENGIISGKSANTFDPDANMTRAEFLTLALKVPSVPTPTLEPSYDDVAESQWFAKTVGEAKKRNLIPDEMVSDNKFNPDQPITREEMTAIIVRLWDSFRNPLTPAELTFTDITAFSPWAKDAIAKAVTLGVITGNPDGTFNPLGLATRAEASVIFNRLDKKLDTPVTPIKSGEYHPVYGGIYHDDVDIQKIISDAYESGAQEVTIPAGVYKIPLKKGSHLVFDGMKNFTINGYGVTILFDKHYSRGIDAHNTDNLTINGLTIDYEEPLYTQGKIVNIDPDRSYIDIEVEEGYYFDLKDTNFFTETLPTYFYDATRTRSRTASATEVRAKQIEVLGNNRYRLNSFKMISKGGDFKLGDYVVMHSDNQGYPFNATRSNGLKMNDVTIYSGCVAISEGYGNETAPSIYKNIKVVPGPTPLGAVTPRCFSITGTGFHMTGLSKGFEVYDSYVYDNNDDGVNIHGIYHRVYENKSPDTVVIGTGKDSSTFDVGDTLRFYDENYELVDTAKIVSSKLLTDYTSTVNLVEDVGVWTFQPRTNVEIKLDKKLTVAKAGWVENEQEMSNGFILKNCQFIEGQRGLIIKANGIVENCLVQGRRAGLRAGPELHWLESGYIGDLTFKNVIFKENGYDSYNVDGRPAYSCGLFGEIDATTSRNTNVTFDGCTFDSNYNIQLLVGEAKNLTVKNCTFIAGENATVHVSIDNCEDVTFSNNQFDGSVPNILKGDKVKNIKE